jgi:hypothetical protein
MQKNDICIVKRDKGRGHPKGTRVRIIMVMPKEYNETEPYLCQAEDGYTTYWYAEHELEVIEREGLI